MTWFTLRTSGLNVALGVTLGIVIMPVAGLAADAGSPRSANALAPADEVMVDSVPRASMRLEGETMGTHWRVVLGTSVATGDAESLAVAIDAELAAIDATMSTWNRASFLSTFNDGTSTDFIRAEPALLKVLDTALAIGRASGGAYDVTLGEVFRLYGFGAGGDTGALDLAAIDAAHARAGPSSLVRSGDTFRKRDPRVRIELSSIAKGYGVDRLGEIVEESGIRDYLVEIGGEVRTRGRRADGSSWRVGIERPDGRALEGLALSDAHVATSGSYRNWREVDGRRVAHIIDGRDARPIGHALVAVSVIGPSTMEADAWATALLVLGKAEASRLAERHGLDVQFTVRTQDGAGASRFVVHRTAGFAERIVLR